MYGGASQPSPAQLAQARLSAQSTLYNAALGVVLLHSGEMVSAGCRGNAFCVTCTDPRYPPLLFSSIPDRLPEQALLKEDTTTPERR
jgi:hypothetical protein